MSDVTFLSMLAMFAAGVALGRGRKRIDVRQTTWVFLVFLWFYILAGVFGIAG